MRGWRGRVAILGIGLLGASLARALRKYAASEHIVGYGRTESHLQRALAFGIIDEYRLDPSEAVADADFVVFATPVGRFLSLADDIRGSLKPGALVIDVGSVKGALIRQVESRMPEGVSFVGCHPIAGGETSGIDESRADLFEGAECILTPTGETGAAMDRSFQEAAELWQTLGARVVTMSPEEHDTALALVSHFPHVAAYALVSAVGDVSRDALAHAGRGFIDTTRIALSPPDLWREICLLNRDNLLRALGAFRKNLESIEKCLIEGDADGLEKAFGRAREMRETLGH